jgi:hypothetical protein
MKREIAERIVAAIKDFDQAYGQLDIALSEIYAEVGGQPRRARSAAQCGDDP